MKQVLIMILLLPVVVRAQSRQDYVRQADKFVKLFNQQQTDSICAMFPDEKTTGLKCFWAGASTDGTYDRYGKITACEFQEADSTATLKPAVFKVVFTKKGTKTLLFALNAAHKFTVFRIEEWY